MELGQAKKIFLITKRSENVTARTLEIYEDVLKKFFEHLIEEDVYAVTEVNPNHIRAFLVDLQDKGLRGVTRHIYFRKARGQSRKARGQACVIQVIALDPL